MFIIYINLYIKLIKVTSFNKETFETNFTLFKVDILFTIKTIIYFYPT